eukprot:759000-Hanusia_phi.AAC.2
MHGRRCVNEPNKPNTVPMNKQQGNAMRYDDPMLDCRWSNWMPEPIMCWACGHELGEKCHNGVRFGRPCPHAEPGKRCNGYAFPGHPPYVGEQNRTPLKDYYILVDGHIMYVHHRGDDRVFVPVNVDCDVCGRVHQA